MDQDVLDGDLHSQAGSNDRATRNIEQLGYPQGYRGKLGYSGYQMLPHPDIGDPALDRQLFTYLEQLEDPVRPRTPGAGAIPDIGDTILYRQFSTYLLQKQLQDTYENQDFHGTQENQDFHGTQENQDFHGTQENQDFHDTQKNYRFPFQLQTKIYSPFGSMNRATGDLEQLQSVHTEENQITQPVLEAALNSPEDPEYRDTALCRLTLHRPVVESTAEPEDPETGDAALDRSIVEAVQDQEIMMQQTLGLVDSSSQTCFQSSKVSS